MSGHKIDVRYKLEQDSIERVEPESRWTPESRDPVGYGRIHRIVDVEIAIDSITVVEGVTFLEDIVPSQLYRNIDAYASELLELVTEYHHDIEPLPQGVLRSVDVKFCKEILVNFLEHLESLEHSD